MLAPARRLALAISLLFAATVVHPAPAQAASRHGKKKKLKRPAVRAPEPVEDTPDARATTDDMPPSTDDAPRRDDGPSARTRVAFDEPGSAGGDPDKLTSADDAPVKLATVAARPARDWHITIGPYLWASSVDANVSIGSSSVGAGVDFVPLARHAKYGVELLGEVRYGRFAISGDLMYGAVEISGAAGIGPVMTSLTGNASSLLVDGAAGYEVAGDETSLAALELRAGVRYQRTTVNGELALGGYSLQTPESVTAGSDGVIGARGFLRPRSWFFLSGVFDVGVFGASTTTWSASVDASVHVTSHVLLSLGYRTLTLDRSQVNIVMHGPRAAVQLVF